MALKILAILPTGAGKTVILSMFIFIPDHMSPDPGRFSTTL